MAVTPGEDGLFIGRFAIEVKETTAYIDSPISGSVESVHTKDSGGV